MNEEKDVLLSQLEAVNGAKGGRGKGGGGGLGRTAGGKSCSGVGEAANEGGSHLDDSSVSSPMEEIAPSSVHFYLSIEWPSCKHEI